MKSEIPNKNMIVKDESYRKTKEAKMKVSLVNTAFFSFKLTGETLHIRAAIMVRPHSTFLEGFTGTDWRNDSAP